MSNFINKILSNRYRIEESLGRGGMAEVYKAWDQERAAYLALKVLRQDLSRDVIFLRRFKREAQTLEKLQHPNIVRFYGIEKDDLTVYMLMDYIEGTTLQDEIFRSDGKPCQDEFIHKVINSVSSALHYAHSLGLVHCDIKPGNIMINKEGSVFITDFGIARLTDAATSTMVGFGTPAYMAPELVQGRDPTPQSDIYSLGVVLYEMVTGGERPFTGERPQTTGSTSEKVRWEQVHLEPPPLREINPEISNKLETIIQICLKKTSEDRYQSALEMKEEFLSALTEGQAEVEELTEAENESPSSSYEGEVGGEGDSNALLSIIKNPVALWIIGGILMILVVTCGFVIRSLRGDIDDAQRNIWIAANTQTANAEVILTYKTQQSKDSTLIQNFRSTSEAGEDLIDELSEDLSGYSSSLSQNIAKVGNLENHILDMEEEIEVLEDYAQDLTDEIDDLEDDLPVKVTIKNDYYHDQFIRLDGSIFLFVPKGSTRTFYIKPGSYSMAACHPNNLGNCSSWGTENLTYNRSFTIEN